MSRPAGADSRRRLLKQIGSFGLVGVGGLLVDTALLYFCLRVLGMGFYGGRLLSWLGAATFTWYCNRVFTFRGASPDAGLLRQWGAFLGANSFGGAVNYAVYAVLVATSATVREWPFLAVGAGSVAGLLFNFGLSRRFVFRG
jgi:putative flippase GtrA